MQKLQFESSWEKTLSSKDRERIQQVFLETTSTNKGILLTPLWEAVNHKEELLVTVLIHNFEGQAFTFHDKKLRYVENNKVMAEHTFTLPSLIVGRETSMPWTFIFPARKWSNHATLKSGHLEIED